MKHKKHNSEETKQENVNEQAAPEPEAADNGKNPADESVSTEKAENYADSSDNAKEAEDEKVDQAENEAAKEVLELKKQCEENFNRLLRMQADFENYKKRVAKEREEMYNSALETIITQILPVVDNMERAAGVFKNDGLDGKYVEGVEMVLKQLIGVLEGNGLKEIEALGKDFDPNIHHAVMRAEGEAEEENKVKEVFQKGYMLGNKVIRPSLVKVVVR